MATRTTQARTKFQRRWRARKPKSSRLKQNTHARAIRAVRGQEPGMKRRADGVIELLGAVVMTVNVTV
jgi:hypothetical protein